MSILSDLDTLVLRQTSHPPLITKGAELTYAEMDARATAMYDAIQSIVSGANVTAYDAGATYDQYDPDIYKRFAGYNGRIWKAIYSGSPSTFTGETPSESVYWTQVTLAEMIPDVLGLVDSLGHCCTLDESYDSGGAGLGRTITADAGAVEIVAANTDAALDVSGYSSLANTDIDNNAMFFGIQADDEPLTYFAIYQGDDGTLTGMKLDKDGGQHIYQDSTGNTAHGGALSDGFKVGASGDTYWGKMWLEYDEPSRLKSELVSNALQYAEVAVTPYMVSIIADESEINCSLKVITTTGAFTPPVLTTTQRNALTPDAGMMIYNSDANKHQGYDGTIWNDLY
jgi:hypothetical protein